MQGTKLIFFLLLSLFCSCSYGHCCYCFYYDCQVIKDRVMDHAIRSSFTWNTEPGSVMILPEFSQSLGDYPFYWRHLRVNADTNSFASSLFTAVVYVTSRNSLYSASPLHRLMRAVSKSSKLHKVVCQAVYDVLVFTRKFCGQVNCFGV